MSIHTYIYIYTYGGGDTHIIKLLLLLQQQKTILQLEKDKLVTHEKAFSGGWNGVEGVKGVEEEVRQVARLKVRMLRGE